MWKQIFIQYIFTINRGSETIPRIDISTIEIRGVLGIGFSDRAVG